VSIDGNRAKGALANLNGEMIATHQAELNGAQGEAALQILKEVINGLIAQLDASLLCISIGTPGIVYNKEGFVKAAPLLGWYDFPLAAHLNQLYEVPVCVGNNTELATRALVAFSQAEDQARNLVMVLVDGSVEIGIAFANAVYHHSGDLGLLRVPPSADQLAAYLGWDFVSRRIRELYVLDPNTSLDLDTLDYLAIRNGYQHGDWLCTVLYDELARHLAQIFAWITGIIRPDHITLAGQIVEMGAELIALATERAANLLPPDLVDAVTFSLATDVTLSVSGTIAHALERELGVLA
jgi:predicted NBD/HSP70 family sugar kinase